MEQKFQTSFIPKKPVATAEKPNTAVSGRGMGLFLFISIIIFVISAGIAGWIYLDKKMLLNSITEQQALINQNKNSFDTNTIDSIILLNSRINVAKGLLTSHMAITPIFNFLQQETLKNVRFKDFSFSTTKKNEAGQAGVGIQLTGVAKDFETVASQADEFGKADWKKFINEPKISNFSLNADGSVTFTFTANITKDFITYGQYNNLSSTQ